MNRKQKIIVSITGIFIVLLALVGLTYAYFLTRITGNSNDKSISVTTANLELVYQDGNGILKTSKLEPSNDYITFFDDDGNEHESKIFTVTNNGNATVEGYKVYLENVQNQLERKDDLVYTLSCKSYTKYGEEDQAISGECTGVNTETTFPSVITNIVSNDIAVGITHEYELKAKYKEMNVDQSIDMNKVISAKINIADAKTKYLAREIMDNALSTETVAHNKTIYIEPSLQDGTTYTIPAEQTNKEDERILTYTFDDYGTSYYFRGAVEDNYVNFAGMCWRIVRIEGDGSIKLILDDRYAECNDNETIITSTLYTGNWSDGKNYKYGYNDKYELDFLNYSGGLADSFNSFQTSKLTSINLEKLKVDEWCYDDKETIINETCHDYDLDGIEETCYVTKKYYGTYTRIIKDYNPSLKCLGTKLTKFKDGTSMYVATLTADEIAFAGGTSSSTNQLNFYLSNDYILEQFENSGGFEFSHWSLLSPVGYDTYVPHAFITSAYAGRISDVSLENSSGNRSRPAITLKKNITTITNNDIINYGQPGTRTNPYVIN